MRCPFCATVDTKVVDSRLNQTGDITRRRRECPSCDSRFTTYERVEEVMPVVIKKDGRREDFNRNKLFSGVEKACHKRPVKSVQIEDLIRRVEKRIQSFGLKEIPSRTVGQMVMLELHQLDKVAFVRFASVYREFKDVDEFLEELKTPPKAQEDPQALTFSFVEEENSETSASS